MTNVEKAARKERFEQLAASLPKLPDGFSRESAAERGEFQGYLPLTTPYANHELWMLERIIADLRQNRIPFALAWQTAPLITKGRRALLSVEVWRPGMINDDNTSRLASAPGNPDSRRRTTR